MKKQSVLRKDWPIGGAGSVPRLPGWTYANMPVLKVGGGPAPKKAKYSNTKCEQDGFKFDSLREKRRYEQLAMMQEGGAISALELQVVFVLAPAVTIAGRKRPPLRYVADFVYEQDGTRVIEDVKGVVTEGYRIKRHLMAVLGHSIVEIR